MSYLTIHFDFLKFCDYIFYYTQILNLNLVQITKCVKLEILCRLLMCEASLLPPTHTLFNHKQFGEITSCQFPFPNILLTLLLYDTSVNDVILNLLVLWLYPSFVFQDLDAFSAAVVITLAFSFIPASFAVAIVKVNLLFLLAYCIAFKK